MFSFSGGRRVLIIAEGSRGDCQPYLALAEGLREAGYVLKFFTNPNHVETYESLGFDALGFFHDTEQQFRHNETMRDAMQHGDFGKWFKCVVEVRLPIFEEVLRKSCAAVEEFKPELIVYGSLSRPLATCLSLQYGIPAVGALLQFASPTRFAPSMLNEPSWLPGWCHMACHLLVAVMGTKGWQPFEGITLKVLPDIEPYVNSLSKQLVNQYHPLLKPIVGASPLLNKALPDWHPSNVPLFTGPWVLNAETQTKLVQANNKLFGSSKELKDALDFLEEPGSSKPIYMGWGSMVAFSPEHMAKLAVRTLMVLGRRGLIVGGFAQLKESMLEGEPDLQEYASKNVRFIAAAPHEVLFPKCAALVHHGGAGTLAAALRSGVPQVVTPVFIDQFDSANKVNYLKVGVGLPKFQLCTVQKVAEALQLVLSDSTIQENARQQGIELCKESSVSLAVNEIKRDFSEEIDTGNWKAKFEARKLLLQKSEKAMTPPSLWAWIRRIFSRTATDFLSLVE